MSVWVAWWAAGAAVTWWPRLPLGRPCQGEPSVVCYTQQHSLLLCSEMLCSALATAPVVHAAAVQLTLTSDSGMRSPCVAAFATPLLPLPHSPPCCAGSGGLAVAKLPTHASLSCLPRSPLPGHVHERGGGL